MDKYILFHGSHQNFDEFNINLIDLKSLINQGNGGSMYGHYFLGYDEMMDDGSNNFKNSITSLFKSKLYSYIEKHKQFTDGYIYQVDLLINNSNLLNYYKITLSKEEIIYIVESLFKQKLGSLYDNFCNQLKNDKNIYEYLCSKFDLKDVIQKFIEINKFGIINMSSVENWGTMVIFDDSKLVISHKKYINILNEKENKIIF